MNINRLTTDGKAVSTGKLMREVVEKHYRDMAPYASLSLIQVYNLIKSLPYRPDPEHAETLMRPRYTMNMQGYGGDCDDKVIALASWARLRNMPYRFVAIRRPERKNLHHVSLELYIKDRWVHFDPTYRFNMYGVKRPEAERIVM